MCRLPPLRTSGRGSRDVHDEILAAALVVFFRHGFRRATMEDVAREANVSRQTLYTRFGGKESLFVAAAETILDSSVQSLQQAIAGDSAVWDRIYHAFEAGNVSAVRELARSEHGAELMATRSTLLHSLIVAKEKKMVSAIADVLGQAWESGEITIDESTSPRAIAEMLVTADAGFKADVTTVRRYRSRLRTAINMMRLATKP